MNNRRLWRVTCVGVGAWMLGNLAWVAGCNDDTTAGTGPSSATAGGGAAGGADPGGSGGVGGEGGASAVCTTTAPGPTRGSAVAVSPDDTTVLSVNRDAGTLTVMAADGALLTKSAEIAIGAEPWQVAIDGCGDRAYVVSRRDQKVVLIEDITSAPVVAAEASVGSEPTAVAISPNNTAVYVANWVDGTITVLDPVTLAVTQTIDLNAVIADTGLLGLEVFGSPRAALAHPRSIAITNDGDAEDGDETIAVTEFFALRTEAEADDGSNVDVNWQGLLYTIDAANGQVDTIPLGSIADTGFDNHLGADTGCFPNQLQSVTIRGSLAYVTSICASPRGPVGAFQKKACTNNTPCTDLNSTCDTTLGACTLQCTVDADCGFGAPAGTCVAPNGVCRAIPTNTKTMTQPVLSIVDLGAAEEVAGPINLAQAFDLFYAGSPDDASRRYPLVSNDVAFDPATGDAYVTANGADAVFRVSIDDAGALVEVGDSVHPFVDLADPVLDPELLGRSPTGIAMAHDGGIAFVASQVSRTVSAVDLATQDVTAAAVSSPLPADPNEQARLRGMYAFNTGLDRWSLKGQAWSACSVCHFEGLSDNITWYFARGPRQSTSLDGSFASDDPTDQRIFNWTSVFDEVEDFENVARGLNGAVGAIVHTESMPPVNGDRINLATAGAANLNGSAEVVAATSEVDTWADIKIFIQSVRSPRAPTNLEAAAIAAGRTLFEDLTTGGRCQGCHGGAKWTLSSRFYTPSTATNGALLTEAYDGAALVTGGFPAALLPAATGQQFMRGPSPTPGGNDQIQCVLRPVGTFDTSDPAVNVIEVKQDMTSVAQGNAADGKGYNVPSLLGLSIGAPYFHAGNARTLEELLADIFAAHRDALSTLGTLSTTERAQLVAFLLSIDEDTITIALPGTVGENGGDFCVAP